MGGLLLFYPDYVGLEQINLLVLSPYGAGMGSDTGLKKDEEGDRATHSSIGAEGSWIWEISQFPSHTVNNKATVQITRSLTLV